MSKELSSVLELLKNKKLVQAEKECSQLIQKVEPNHDMHNIYAVILFQLKKYVDAIFEWEKAISLKPNYHFGYNNLGNAFLLKNDLNQALKNYNKAIKKIYEKEQFVKTRTLTNFKNGIA